MKTIKMVVLALCATFMLAACGGETPESVAESYVKSYIAIDYKKAAKLATKEYGDEILDGAKEIPEETLKELIAERKEELKDIKYEIVNVEVDEEEAVISFEFTLNGDTEDGRVNLVKENGKWKVESERFYF